MVAVFLKDLRLILRDRWLVVFTLVVPILVVTIIASALFDSESSRLLIPIVDEDQGPVSTTFRKLLSEHADVEVMSLADAEKKVREVGRSPVAIVFPAGLSKRYLQGRSSTITLLTDPGEVRGVQAVKVLLLLMDKEAAALADPLAEEMIVVEEKSLTGNRFSITSFEQNVPGFSIMFMLMAVIFGTAAGLHDERDWGTLPRLLVAPAGFTWMLIGKLGARYVLGFVQMVILLLWGHFVFGMSLGSSPAGFLLLSAAVVFSTVASGLVVAGLSKSREQTQPLSLAVVMALSALGGLWWPQYIVPEWMQRVSSLVYTTWAMRGMNDLVLRDRGLEGLLWPIGILVLYGLITLLIGLKLFRARHSAR